jgi:hypothetical protein
MEAVMSAPSKPISIRRGTPERPLKTPGTPFNPWFDSCGFYPQDVVGRQPHDGPVSLTDGQKRLYERLVRYAARGRAFPAQTTLAEELGKSERQIRADIHHLRDVKLIDCKARPENRRSHEYVFLWHPIFDNTGSTLPLSTPDDTGSGLPVFGAINTGSGLPVSDGPDERTPAVGFRQIPATFDTNTGSGLPLKTKNTNIKTLAAAEPIDGEEYQGPASQPKLISTEPDGGCVVEDDWVDFVRQETRCEIGGREADEGTVLTLARLLNRGAWLAFRQRFKQFCLRETPETWGIVVNLAKDVNRATGNQVASGRVSL